MCLFVRNGREVFDFHMRHWRMNTNRGAREDLRTCDLWYKFGMAFAGDFGESERRHNTIFPRLSPGDGVFMHHSGLGIVGYWIVKEEWNSKIYQGAERRLYVKEPYEYRIEVHWDADCDWRENPLPINGRLPYAGTYSNIDPRAWNVHSVLQDLRKRAKLR